MDATAAASHIAPLEEALQRSTRDSRNWQQKYDAIRLERDAAGDILRAKLRTPTATRRRRGHSRAPEDTGGVAGRDHGDDDDTHDTRSLPASPPRSASSSSFSISPSSAASAAAAAASGSSSWVGRVLVAVQFIVWNTVALLWFWCYPSFRYL